MPSALALKVAYASFGSFDQYGSRLQRATSSVRRPDSSQPDDHRVLHRREIPARRQVRRRLVARDGEADALLGEIGGEAGASTHTINLDASADEGKDAARARLRPSPSSRSSRAGKGQADAASRVVLESF